MNIEKYLKGDYVKARISEGQRFDGRGMDEHRKIEIIKDYVGDKADGSAFLKLGETQVLVGISTDIGEPYPDRPKEGVMITSAELRPAADPTFELGPPREGSIELARVVDRGIRESGAIDTSKLFIGEDKVWLVFIDVHILNNEGNLIDAAGTAAATALNSTRLPKIEDGKIVRGEWEGKLPVTCTPIPITWAKIGANVVVDPTLDEEYAMDARLTVATTDTVNAMQKGGIGSFSVEEVKDIVNKSFGMSGDIRKKVEE